MVGYMTEAEIKERIRLLEQLRDSTKQEEEGLKILHNNVKNVYSDINNMIQNVLPDFETRLTQASHFNSKTHSELENLNTIISTMRAKSIKAVKDTKIFINSKNRNKARQDDLEQFLSFIFTGLRALVTFVIVLTFAIIDIAIFVQVIDSVWHSEINMKYILDKIDAVKYIVAFLGSQLVIFASAFGFSSIAKKIAEKK